MDRLPKRLGKERSRTQEATVTSTEHEGRILSDSMHLHFWTDADGRQHVEITSRNPMTPLQAKGLLHDALYSLVHTEEIATH